MLCFSLALWFSCAVAVDGAAAAKVPVPKFPSRTCAMNNNICCLSPHESRGVDTCMWDTYQCVLHLSDSTVYHIISYLGMKSWDLHVCDRASTITHVDRVKNSNPWYNKIWLCLNVTIWSSQICFSVIFIHFVMIQNIWEKNCTYSHFFQSPVTPSAYFWSALKAC